jgi:hypothetical protein
MATIARCCGLIVLFCGLLACTATITRAEDPPPAAFQAMLKKHGVEEIDHLLDKCSTFEKTKKKALTSEEREELLTVALEEKLGVRERETLITTLYISLLYSETRAQESVDLAPLLEKFQSQKIATEARHWSFVCQAFALEHKETGREREQAWFQWIGQATGKDRIALLVALSYTKWTDREQRFADLRKIYVDKTSDEETRLTIAAVIFQGTIYGGLPLEYCIIHFRDLAKLPETSPAVTDKMFTYLAEAVHMARIMSQMNSTK